jgi:hypothetical protein
MDRRPPSLFLAGEASAVIAALRSNLKFNRYAVCQPCPIGASISPSCLPCQQPAFVRTPRPCWRPTLLQDDEVEDPLLEEFKVLRRKLSSWHSEPRCRRAPPPPARQRA